MLTVKDFEKELGSNHALSTYERDIHRIVSIILKGIKYLIRNQEEIYAELKKIQNENKD